MGQCLLLRSAFFRGLAIGFDGLHKAVKDSKSVALRRGKALLWELLLSLRRANPLLNIVWVPSHGRDHGFEVPEDWRIFNKAADTAASDRSKLGFRAIELWWESLSHRRRAIQSVLATKVRVFRDPYLEYFDRSSG